MNNAKRALCIQQLHCALIATRCRVLLEGNEPAADGAAHRVGPIHGAQLPRDRGHVELDRLIADAERAGDRFIGQPFRQELEDLGLARRQRFREWGVVVTGLGRYWLVRIRSRHDDGVGVHALPPSVGRRRDLTDDLDRAALKVRSQPCPIERRAGENDAHLI